MLDYFDHLLEQIHPSLAYLILFISSFIENTFPPIPGDTVTVLGAYLTTTGRLGFWGVYLSTTTGSIFGFFSMYLIGLKFGRQFLNTKFRARIFNETQIIRVQHWFAQYGYLVIAGNRFLSGTRSVISLFAGFFHLKWGLVLLLSTLSALVWNGLLIYGGYLLGVNWKSIIDIIGNYNNIVIILTMILIVFFILRSLRKKYRSKQTTKDLT